MILLFGLIKGLITIFGWASGHLLGVATTWIGQKGDQSKMDHERDMMKMEYEFRANTAVQQVQLLQGQIGAIQATADLRIKDAEARVAVLQAMTQEEREKAAAAHQASDDAIETSMEKSFAPDFSNVPKDPKGGWQKFIAGIIVMTDAFNAWMRPISFVCVLGTDMFLVFAEGYALFLHPDLLSSVKAFAALAIVEVFTAALPMVLGALWHERGLRKQQGRKR